MGDIKDVSSNNDHDSADTSNDRTGNQPHILTKVFTRRQIEIAIEVLSQSRFVLKWCKGEAKAYGVEENTPEYAQFVKEKSRQYAKRLLR